MKTCRSGVREGWLEGVGLEASGSRFSGSWGLWDLRGLAYGAYGIYGALGGFGAQGLELRVLGQGLLAFPRA